MKGCIFSIGLSCAVVGFLIIALPPVHRGDLGAITWGALLLGIGSNLLWRIRAKR